MVDNNKSLELPNWPDKITKQMIEETFAMLEQVEAQFGPAVFQETLFLFVARLIGTSVYRALSFRPKEVQTKDQAYKYTQHNFAIVKSKMCNSMAAAFSGAMSKFAKKHVEYYCDVRIVPETKGKLYN